MRLILSMIILVDRPALGLRPLLKEFGIRCHDMLIYDENKNNFDYFSGSYNLKTYSSENVHPIVKEIMEHGYIIEAGKCRPVESSKNNDSHFSVANFSFHQKPLSPSQIGQRNPPFKKRIT